MDRVCAIIEYGIGKNQILTKILLKFIKIENQIFT